MHGGSADVMLRGRRSEPEAEELKRDQTASSTRASAVNKGAEMALVESSKLGVYPSWSDKTGTMKERVGRQSPNMPVGEDMKTPVPIEDFPAAPVESPKALYPGTSSRCSMKLR